MSFRVLMQLLLLVCFAIVIDKVDGSWRIVALGFAVMNLLILAVSLLGVSLGIFTMITTTGFYLSSQGDSIPLRLFGAVVGIIGIIGLAITYGEHMKAEKERKKAFKRHGHD